MHLVTRALRRLKSPVTKASNAECACLSHTHNRIWCPTTQLHKNPSFPIQPLEQDGRCENGRMKCKVTCWSITLIKRKSGTLLPRPLSNFRTIGCLQNCTSWLQGLVRLGGKTSYHPWSEWWTSSWVIPSGERYRDYRAIGQCGMDKKYRKRVLVIVCQSPVKAHKYTPMESKVNDFVYTFLLTYIDESIQNIQTG